MNRCEANRRPVEELLQARDAARLALHPSQFGVELSLGRAYQNGHGLHECLEAQGLTPIGRKIGFTDRAMSEQFKVSEPLTMREQLEAEKQR